jgi:hypothetical protein
MSALSIKLMVIEIVFYRSVKISDLAALKDRENKHSSEAAKSLILTDQVFTPPKRNLP